MSAAFPYSRAPRCCSGQAIILRCPVHLRFSTGMTGFSPNPAHGKRRGRAPCFETQDFREFPLSLDDQWVTSIVRYDRNSPPKSPSRLFPRQHLGPDPRRNRARCSSFATGSRSRSADSPALSSILRQVAKPVLDPGKPGSTVARNGEPRRQASRRVVATLYRDHEPLTYPTKKSRLSPMSSPTSQGTIVIRFRSASAH